MTSEQYALVLAGIVLLIAFFEFGVPAFTWRGAKHIPAKRRKR